LANEDYKNRITTTYNLTYKVYLSELNAFKNKGIERINVNFE